LLMVHDFFVHPKIGIVIPLRLRCIFTARGDRRLGVFGKYVVPLPRRGVFYVRAAACGTAFFFILYTIFEKNASPRKFWAKGGGGQGENKKKARPLSRPRPGVLEKWCYKAIYALFCELFIVMLQKTTKFI
jgi:hypothetical protein